jgi:tripartite ATP-independent transporter DctM subunit
MDPLLVATVGTLALFALLALGIHIGLALGIVGFLGTWVIVGLEPALWGTVNVFYDKVASYALLPVPMFVLMGYMASTEELSGNIFKSLNKWVGGIRGGIGIATVFSCTLFGTICGSSLVTSSVFSVIAAPQMRRQGMDKRLAYGICASSGLIGMLIPPSILMVVYGVLSGDSVGKLLIAGISPGILLTLAYAGLIVFLVWVRPSLLESGTNHKVTWRERFESIVGLWPVLIVAAVIFGGLFGGVFTPTEAAAVGTFVVALIILFLKRGRFFSAIWPAFVETAKVSAMIFLIFGGAAIFTQFLVLSGIAQQTAKYIIGMQLSVYGFLIVVSLMYLVLGALLDSISMLTITIPVLMPVVRAMGIDPIWYAVVVIMAIEVGMLTPPVGLCVYGAKAVAEPDVTLEDVFAGALPFCAVSLLVLLLLIFYPPLSTILPSLMD